MSEVQQFLLKEIGIFPDSDSGLLLLKAGTLLLGFPSTDSVWPLCPRPTDTTWSPTSWRYPAESPVAWCTQARRPAAVSVALLFLVHGPRQSAKSGVFRYFPLHTAPSLCNRSLRYFLSLQPLVLQTLFL